MIEPEFNDIVDSKLSPSLCLIIPIKHRLHPTYRIYVKDLRACGVRFKQVRTNLDEDTPRLQGTALGDLITRRIDPKKPKNGLDSLLGSNRMRNETGGMRKYRNKKYFKRAIKPASASSSLRGVLQVNIRFPVVKSLRTDEDTYATLICELDDWVNNPPAYTDDGDSLSRRYSVLDIEDGDENEEDEDWDTSDKGYTIRVKPPDGFFNPSTDSPATTTVSSLETPAKTNLTTQDNNMTVIQETSDLSDVEPAVEESRRRSTFSNHRLKVEQNSTEANQMIKATIDDTVAETTSISPDPVSSGRILSISPFARGSKSDPLRIHTRLDSISQGTGMDYESLRNLQIKAQSEPSHAPVKIRVRPVADRPPMSPSNDSDVELGNRSHHLLRETTTVTMTTQQPAVFNSLKSAETHYLANFIISSITSLLILTFMFALLVMDTCVDVRHSDSNDI